MGEKASKVVRTEGESQGNIAKTMDVDSLDEQEWRDCKEQLQEERRPFVIIEGNNWKRGLQASKIQDMMGEYYIWNMPRKVQTPELVKKMAYIGGGRSGTIVGDRTNWTNCKRIEEC